MSKKTGKISLENEVFVIKILFLIFLLASILSVGFIQNKISILEQHKQLAMQTAGCSSIDGCVDQFCQEQQYPIKIDCNKEGMCYGTDKSYTTGRLLENGNVECIDYSGDDLVALVSGEEVLFDNHTISQIFNWNGEKYE